MDVQLESLALAEVQRFLKDVEYKWYDIGLQLGLDPAKLECIKQSGQSNGECLVAMIQLWLKGAEPAPTWGQLCRVLEGSVVGEQQLAATIRREKGDTGDNGDTDDTGGSCEAEGAGTPGLFKYMRTSGLPESERQRLIGRLEGESQSIRLEFATLVHSTETALNHRHIAPKTLVQKFSYYDASLRSEFSKTESIEDIFFVANDYWSFFNYDLLEYVINTFTLSTASILAQYITNFQEYCKRRLCECPSDVAGSYKESGRRIVLKLDDKMSVQRSTLQDLRRLQDQACKVTGVTVMQLLKIEEGCLHLVYRIPHQSIEKINFLPADKKQELTDIGILSMTCEKKMIRWQIESSVFKGLVQAKKTSIFTKTVVVTELATEITLSLSAADCHVMLSAAVEAELEGGGHAHEFDEISLKVIPAIHHNREARTMPCTTVSSKLCNFEIPLVMPLQGAANAEADMFEFFIELFIESKAPPHKDEETITSIQEGVERMQLTLASENDTVNGLSSASPQKACLNRRDRPNPSKCGPNRNSLPPIRGSGYHEHGPPGPGDLRSRSKSTGDRYLVAGTPTAVKTSPQRSASCVS